MRHPALLLIVICSVFMAMVGLSLCFLEGAGGSTAPAAVVNLAQGSTTAAGLAVLTAAGMALWAVTRERLTWRSSCLLLPQLILLWVAAQGSLEAVRASTYADGVPRPGGFIFTDQLPWLAWTAAYTFRLATIWGDLTNGHR